MAHESVRPSGSQSARTVTLNATGYGTLSVLFYVVNASQMLALEARANTAGDLFPVFNSQIAQQAAGSFSNSSLNGDVIVTPPPTKRSTLVNSEKYIGPDVHQAV
jgi:hypothetical protein